jgi:hypothetical protein
LQQEQMQDPPGSDSNCPVKAEHQQQGTGSPPPGPAIVKSEVQSQGQPSNMSQGNESGTGQPLFLARFCAAWVYTGRASARVARYADRKCDLLQHS